MNKFNQARYFETSTPTFDAYRSYRRRELVPFNANLQLPLVIDMLVMM
jgi:hypothetical protein